MGDLSLPMATTARLRACNAVTPICRPCCTHRRSVGGLRCSGAVFVATKKNLERDSRALASRIFEEKHLSIYGVQLKLQPGKKIELIIEPMDQQ